VGFPELREDLRKILALVGVSTVAGLSIMGLNQNPAKKIVDTGAKFRD
jgi:hypothetical protein